ncbi:MAG TPA: hypothetical protein PK992_07185 [Planctomycetaceae bacterium]|nr:hypothetical protein [Planctomycetaceae bacterium]HRA87833.1 hypothetical protein [Planctomycetaceae bacterium]
MPLWLLILCPGCSLFAPEPFWYPPAIPAVSQFDRSSAESLPEVSGTSLSDLDLAAYCDSAGSPDATGHYLRVLESLWPRLESSIAEDAMDFQVWNTYHQCIGRFLICAQRHRQYVPGTGVVINDGMESRTVPVHLVGLPWTPEDIQQLFPVGAYHARSLSRQVKHCGLGVPVVARRTCPTGLHPGDQFVSPGSVFSMTAVFRTERADPPGSDSTTVQPIIEFYNPLNVSELNVVGVPRSLARDLSAPFAFQEVCGSDKVDPFEWFIHPEPGEGRDELFFIEPWQPGKIPVIMIHGLLSSPRTWVDMANELRSIPVFSDRYQIWGFRYATGRPFMASAAVLRRDLCVALSQLKQIDADPALDHVVLVGHSMGGLIAKAQISFSGDKLWFAAANRSLSQITADQDTRNRLDESFYFAPQPSVRRVVFVAVPHRGSTLATRLVGQIGTQTGRALWGN